MPSPFPGMDPFIEAQEWGDFHGRLNLTIADELQPLLTPACVVRIERRVYVEYPRDDGLPAESRVADVAIAGPRAEAAPFPATPDGSIATVEPVSCEVALSEEQRESYLVIRDVVSEQIVTVIETLSPANKRQGSAGRRKYLKKRKQVLDSESHFVEIDLLRGGTRMPIVPRPQEPVGDYRVMVSRAERRPRVVVYAWPLMHALPTITVPLLREDERVELNLQQTFGLVYERAAYQLSLDYAAELSPPLPEAVKAWVRERTAARA